MNVFAALILFGVFIAAYIIIVEVFTVLFRLTGLTEEKARMQVVSMLTNTGFTTKESELVTASQQRRRLARATILFGYSFTVIIVSSIINLVLAMNKTQAQSFLVSGGAAVILFLFLFLIMRVNSVKQGFDRLIERLGNRLLFGRGSNALVLVDIYGEMAMAEVELENLPEFLAGTPLSASRLKEEHHVQIVFVERGNSAITPITGETVLQKEDRILAFGPYKNIRAVFEHPGED